MRKLCNENEIINLDFVLAALHLKSLKSLRTLQPNNLIKASWAPFISPALFGAIFYIINCFRVFYVNSLSLISITSKLDLIPIPFWARIAF